MDNKTKVLQAWKRHKDVFQYSGFELDGHIGFIAIDGSQSPSHWVSIIHTDKGFRGYQGFYDIKSLEDIEIVLRDDKKKNISPDEAFPLFGITGSAKETWAENSIRAFEESLNSSVLKAILPRKDLIKGEQDRILKNGLQSIIDTLSPDGIKALQTQDKFLWKDYEYFAGGGDKHIYRKQAAESYPMFTGLMTSRFSIRNAIDAQQSLQKSLQNIFGEDKDGKPIMSKALLKRFQGLEYPLNGLTIEKIVTTLSQIPPDWFPKNREEWDAFCDITATIGSTLPKITGSDMNTLLTGCQGKWCAYKEKLINDITDTRPPEGLSDDFIKIIDEYLDINRFKSMSKNKVRAAAEVLTKGLETLPEGVGVDGISDDDPLRMLPYGITRDDIIDWIERMYAPQANRVVLASACYNVDDMARIFSEKVILPLAMNRTGEKISYTNQIIQEQSYREATKILFSKMSASAILEGTRHFMTRVTEIMAAGGRDLTDEEKMNREAAKRASGIKKILGLPDEPSEDAWAPLITPVKAPNGLYLVPLTESYLLKDEGRGWGGHSNKNEDGTTGLSMCVGEMGYDKKCRSQGHHIISVREVTDDGLSYTRLGCAEISKVKKDNTFVVNQFRYKNNSDPGAKAKAALDWFKRSVADGSIALNHDGIMQYHASIKKTDEVVELCGYNWRDRDLIFKAMAPWGKYVGKAYRKMNVDMFADSDAIMKIAKEINPSTPTDGESISPHF